MLLEINKKASHNRKNSKDLYPEYIKTPYNSVIRKQITEVKVDTIFAQIFHRRK